MDNSPYKNILFLLIVACTVFACSENTRGKEAINKNQTSTINTNNSLNIDINQNWKFIKTEQLNAQMPSYNDKDWRTVNIPHDWSIEDLPEGTGPFSKKSEDAYDTGYTLGGIAWYRKSFYLPISQQDKLAYLDFGGIYMNSEIYINGIHVGGQHNGYTSFWLEISKQLKYDQHNVIAVKVNNNHKNSRWYSGSGIYRKVQLSFSPQIHVNHDGAVITSTVNDSDATVNIRYSVNNLPAESKTKTEAINIKNEIIKDEKIVAHSLMPLDINQQKDGQFSQSFSIDSPQLWSLSSPHLYQLKQTILIDNVVSESRLYTFGIRTLNFSAKQGFTLNQKPILLKGMNLHHDNYMLGSAVHKHAEERKVKRIISAGYNAVRTSHNPPSKAFLNAADKHGLLVITELFDSWNKHKWDHVNDYASVFATDWQHDLTRFIKRDQNHPSIIMWSIGNEIPEQGEDIGASTAKMLSQAINQLDDTRPVTIGANTSGPYSDKFLQNFSVVGYNYQQENYLSDHQRFPNRVMFGSETYSSSAFTDWQLAQTHPYVIGDFVWTGWDYLGEASIGWTGYAPEWKGLAPFPWHLAYCGEIDALGYKRAAAYYRDVIWQTGDNKISAFVKSPIPSLSTFQNPDWYQYWVQDDLHPNWTWTGFEDKPLQVHVFSRYEQVELLLNGRSLGKKSSNKSNAFKNEYTVNYQAGNLTAVGYEKGIEQERWQLNTTFEPTTIQLSTDVDVLSADGEDLIYVTAQLLDINGQPIYHWSQDVELNFNVVGPAKVIAVGNADPISTESFQASKRKTFRGRVVAILQSTGDTTGEVTIEVSSAAGNITQTLTVSAIK